MNPFEPPQAEQRGPAQPPDDRLPSWLRNHPLDGPMMALVGASMVALGWYVEHSRMMGIGGTLAAIGLVLWMRAWLRRKR